MERLESDIHALKLQALATQKSIQQLQTHEPANPLQTVQSAFPGLPSGLDGTVVGVAAALGLILALAWWYLWYRPQTRLNKTVARRAEAHQPTPKTATLSTQTAAYAPPAPASTLADDVLDSYFARNDPDMGFDSEAAAGEVVRVRRSLADKREARTQQQEIEREEASRPTPKPHAVVDITRAEPEMVLDLELDLEPDPEPASAQLAVPVPESVPAPEPDFTAEPEPELELEPVPINLLEPMPMPMPQPDLELQPEQPFLPQTDFSITLALAEESEALELWPEARELATEVLDSSDAILCTKAQALLARLDVVEHTMAQELLPPPELAQKDPTA